MSDVVFTSWHPRVLQVESEGVSHLLKSCASKLRRRDMLKDMLKG